MKKIFKKLLFFAFAAALFLPACAFGATMGFLAEQEKVYQGDIFSVSLRISELKNPINAVNAYLFFDKDFLEAKQISTGESILSIFAENPSFSNDSGLISFVGGIPDGFSKKEGELIKIYFLAKKEGPSSLSITSDTAVFLNDGKGTKDDLLAKSALISVLARPEGILPKDEWEKSTSADKTPPDDFKIFISKDPLFQNKYFITFFAKDSGTGIDHYEIKEGDKPYLKATSPYILQDQSLKNQVFVKAVDKAGNIKVMAFNPNPNYWPLIIALAAIAIAIIIIFILWKRRKK